ncbi:hypothetical protein B0H10DRAFT_1965029 [Mycena sp. CBHHK59/15]|nr:hypothetical protein B0H10DRAFT_1965029 [Mycena sp. CBHHK59/15]
MPWISLTCALRLRRGHPQQVSHNVSLIDRDARKRPASLDADPSFFLNQFSPAHITTKYGHVEPCSTVPSDDAGPDAAGQWTSFQIPRSLILNDMYQIPTKTCRGATLLPKFYQCVLSPPFQVDLGPGIDEVLRWLPHYPFAASRNFRLRPQYSIPRTITPELSASVRSLVSAILTHHLSRNPLVIYTTALILDDSTVLLCIAAQKTAYDKQQCLQASTGSLEDLDFSFIFKDTQHADLLTPDWQRLVTWQDFHDLSLAEFPSYTPNVRRALWNIGNVKGQHPQDRGPHAYISVGYEESSNDGFYSICSGPVDMVGSQKLEAIFDLDENHPILGSLVTHFKPKIKENKIKMLREWCAKTRTVTSDIVLDAYRVYYNRLAHIEEESAIVACMRELETYARARAACEAA